MPNKRFKDEVIKKVSGIPIESVIRRFGFRPQVIGDKRSEFLCFFHQEKTASLVTNREHNYYYCYGCHDSGDVIELVRKLKGCGFRPAVFYLATKVLGLKAKELFSDTNLNYRPYFF